jgi:hypothetical protein
LNRPISGSGDLVPIAGGLMKKAGEDFEMEVISF